MNKTNFIQTGGWPLKSERLQELQTAYSIFNAYGSLAGNLTIISGCETLGTTVQDGVVYIDGELYDFKSASVTPTSTVIIIETPINRGFKNGVVKTVHTLRYATFGTAETSWPWADFKRPFPTKEIPADLNEQLETIETKESIEKVSALEARIKALENKTTPQVKITSGTLTVTAMANGYYQNDYSKNYADVLPPDGYSTAHLAGFVASIAEIHFNGDVNKDDTFWCKHTVDTQKIRIICSNSEARAASKVNYMAVWIK